MRHSALNKGFAQLIKPTGAPDTWEAETCDPGSGIWQLQLFYLTTYCPASWTWMLYQNFTVPYAGQAVWFPELPGMITANLTGSPFIIPDVVAILADPKLPAKGTTVTNGVSVFGFQASDRGLLDQGIEDQGGGVEATIYQMISADGGSVRMDPSTTRNAGAVALHIPVIIPETAYTQAMLDADNAFNGVLGGIAITGEIIGLYKLTDLAVVN